MMRRVEYPTRVGYGDNGRVIVLDWETKQEVLPQAKIYDLRKPDNPMSRSHGCRGICFHRDKLYVGGGDSLVSILDPETNQLEETILTPAKRIHQLKEHNDIVYVISTGTNSYYKLQGRDIVGHVSVSDVRPFVESYLHKDPQGLGALVLKHLSEQSRVGGGDWREKDQLHFNSIDWHPETGEEHHVYYTPGLVFNYARKEIVLDGLVGAHDLRIIDADTYIVNDSMNRTSLRVSSVGRDIIYQADSSPPEGIEFKGEKEGQNHALWGYTRVAVTAGNSLFVSSAPGRLVEINTDTWEQVDIFDTTLDPGDSLYDIALHPEDWR